MLAFLRQLSNLKEITGLSLVGVLAIIRKLADIGAPPPIEQEAQLRTWLLSVVAVLDEIAEDTPNEIDDGVVDFTRQMLNSSLSWSIGYKMLQYMLDHDDELAGAGMDELDSMAEQLAASMVDEGNDGISPALIISIISAVFQIIKLLRR